ncbi:MFS transporter [Nocardia sp. CDC159]|uniref:MFS transporter n=1 Tax=Nocardia pulmonis TaxID=2951408 RepID=A0A9X2EC82_9NOCA|nr:MULTISPECIES: MFS transporter [Nocardia]MCM6775501.1 MFS transporter [Nocardia pulmonis]MCM6787765.1 MFS transporter [Nocardia sp. CDC159]
MTYTFISPPSGTPDPDRGAAARPFDWFRTLGARGKRAFIGAFGGYGLDSYDFQVLPLSLGAIASYFAISTGQSGLLTTVTLVVSALGGAIAGTLADRIGRVRTLQLTIAMYAIFTVLCGFAWNFESLMVFRALQGLGFGGEWAAGAILVAEYARPEYRGRAVAFVQSAWAAGWGLAVCVYTVVFQVFDESVAWRVLFFTGALPALLIVWVRRSVTDAAAHTERLAGTAERGRFGAIFGRDLLRTTFFAALLATGVQGGYYTLATWLPTYLKKSRHLTVVGTGGYLVFLILGAFLGYVSGGILTDKLGRKRNIQLFAVLSVVFMVAYTQIPQGADTLVLVLGFPLGFATSAIFSGFGSYLSELYPTQFRGTGQGFTYNFGRGVGAVFPTVVGYLAGTSLGLTGAMLFGALGYAVAVLALFGLPETRGRELV